MRKNKRTYRLLIIVALSLFGFISVKAQNTLQVYDAETLEPLVYATTIFTNDRGQNKYGTTDEYGEVEIPFSTTTTIQISYIGYQKLHKTIEPNRARAVYLFPYESEINEVVITGLSAEEEVEESMYEVAVIKQDEIESKGANNLRDALMSEMNVRIQQDGVLGSNVSLQGLDGANVKIMIDGVPVVGRVNGNIDLSQINLNNIERIEIIEGPMSVIYGTDAIAGVINLITKSSQDNKWDGNVSSYYESIGTYNVDASVGLKKGNHLLQANGGRYFFNGWNADSYDRNVEWDPKEQYFGGLTYVYRTQSDWFNRFKVNYYSDKILNRKDPTGVFPVAFDDWYKTKR
ncbi:MAG: TonB-dependent receptor, partial [Chitinophagales bacterium]